VGYPVFAGVESQKHSDMLLLTVIELALYEVSDLASREIVAFKIYGELPSAIDDDGVE
jgi:hypothetical protein